jgi:transcriptional regulator with XRE-family HTH domain
MHISRVTMQCYPTTGATPMTDTTDLTIDQQIGQRLRALRQSMGDRQTDFATRIGKERSTVAKYERGERKLSLNDVIEMAQRLHVLPIALLLKLIPQSRSDPNLDALLAVIVQHPTILPTVLRSAQEALQEQTGS